MRILVGHGSVGNLGDTAMLEAVVSRLHQLDPDCTLCVRDRQGLRTDLWDWERVTPTTFDLALPGLPQVPYLWRYEKQCRAVWRNGCHALLDRLIDPGQILVGKGSSALPLDTFCQGYDALHIVGGGNLTDTFPGELWQRCCLIHTFAAQKKPVVLTGQQLGPFRTWWSRDALRRALRKVDFVGLREPTDSLDFCKWAKLSPERYAVTGDDSFGCEAEHSPELDALLSRYLLIPGSFLAVNVRIADYAPSQGNYLQQFAQLVAGLTRHYNMPAVVVPIALNAGDSDIVAGYKLQKVARSGSVQVLNEPELSRRLVKGVLGKAFAAVGVSYHLCTFALSQGIPAISTVDGEYYAQKARGLVRFWGDERLSLPLRECGTDVALKKATDLFDDRQFREVLPRRAKAAVANWQEAFDQTVHRVFRDRGRSITPKQGTFSPTPSAPSVESSTRRGPV